MLTEMDKTLEHKIKISKVQQMKNPVILMNADDLKSFEDKLSDEITGFTPSENPTYRGMPIKTKDFLKRNQIMVYDDVYLNWR